MDVFAPFGGVGNIPAPLFVYLGGRAKKGSGLLLAPWGLTVEESSQQQEVERMKRHFVSLALAVALCLGFVPTVASASQVSATPITYEQAQAKGEAVNLEAVDVSQFKDWDASQWWAKSGGVRYAIGMGYIVGRAGPTVAPYAPVTEAEFVTVLVRACLNQSDIAKYKAQALEEYKQDQRDNAAVEETTAPTDAEMEYSFEHGGVNWYVAGGYYNAGKALGIVNGTMNSNATDITCTRAQMASLLVRAMRARGEDTSTIDTGKAMGKMNDRALYSFQSGAYSGYGQDIGIAIGTGLIAGDENRNFNPGATMTRSEMAEVILRLDNPKMNGAYPRDYAKESVGVEQGTGTGTGEGIVTPISEAITIDMRNPGSHREPREGDTIIRPDGTSVILKRDPETGVLGWGQNVGCYLGTYLQAEDMVIKENTRVFGSMLEGSVEEKLVGGVYQKCDIPGYEYSYHWYSEWERIKDATYPDYKGQDGEISENQLWVYDYTMGGWCWRGPSV